MAEPPTMAHLSLRLPHRLLDALDRIAADARFNVGLFSDCQDYYSGGRSAIVRILLELGIRQYEAKRQAPQRLLETDAPTQGAHT